MPLDDAYDDIPGTIIFDAEQAAKGYALNQMALSLMAPANRERFLADEASYLDDWDLTPEQRQAVLDRDLSEMLAHGGNIYFVARIGASEGRSYLSMVASMTDETEDEYRQMMIEGGRSPEGNRYLSDWEGDR
jgi:protocatechuate 4,5-dioxygenase alpha subunit